jgi:hypothetical protein
MREETIVKYIADDSTPFKDRLDCLHYEKLCEKYKKWLSNGKVMFWSHSEAYMNLDLCDWTFKDNTNYLDWLRKQLSLGCGYVTIQQHPCSEDWEEIWEFVVSYLLIDKNSARKLEPTYCLGDLLVYDQQDCRFHNIDLVIRNANTTKEKLINNIIKT